MKNKTISITLTACETEYLLEAINRKKYYIAINQCVLDTAGDFVYKKLLATFEKDAAKLGLTPMQFLKEWKDNDEKPTRRPNKVRL